MGRPSPGPFKGRLAAALAAAALALVGVHGAGAQRFEPVDQIGPIDPVERPIPVSGSVRPRLIEASALVRATQARATFGVDGKGLTVAVLDTGLRVTHHDFTGKVLAQVNETDDFGGDADNADDNQGHGTNVAGIICAKGLHTGIAPGASVIPIKVLNGQGSGSFDQMATGLQWVLDHRAQFNISAVNMSIQSNNNFTATPSDPSGVVDKVKALRAAGVAVVICAGNHFATFGAEGMAFPGIVQEGISVGAVYDANIGPVSYGDGATANTTAADRFTPFSQRLHPDVGGALRTDIFAPGAALTASGNANDDASSTFHGTSQACPVACGVVMLLQQLHKQKKGVLPSVDNLEKWLRAGAVAIKDGDDEDDNVPHDNKIYPRVEVVNAIQAMLADINVVVSFNVKGTVHAAAGGGLASVRVAAAPGGAAATTAADGTFTLANLPAGSYTIAPTKAGVTFNPASRQVVVDAAHPLVQNVDFSEVLLPPSAPRSLRATAVSKTSIGLTWVDTAGNERGFQAQVRTKNKGAWRTLQGEGAANSTAGLVTGLKKNTLYGFRVRAVNAAGTSAFSNIATGRTKRK